MPPDGVDRVASNWLIAGGWAVTAIINTQTWRLTHSVNWPFLSLSLIISGVSFVAVNWYVLWFDVASTRVLRVLLDEAIERIKELEVNVEQFQSEQGISERGGSPKVCAKEVYRGRDRRKA